MPTRAFVVELSADAAERFDEALTGNDDDLCLAVEKVIMARVTPEDDRDGRDTDALYFVARVETDPDVVDVAMEK